jgi:hypothetical protein
MSKVGRGIGIQPPDSAPTSRRTTVQRLHSPDAADSLEDLVPNMTDAQLLMMILVPVVVNTLAWVAFYVRLNARLTGNWLTNRGTTASEDAVNSWPTLTTGTLSM